MDKIKDLKAKQSDVNIQGVIKEIAPPREFQKFGKPGKVANSTIEDDSGKMTLTLWNDDVDRFEEGDEVKIVNGYVNEWRGTLQLTAGRSGSLEKVEDGDEADESKEEE